eukprot:SAG31_NODE_2287_length_6004_cov_2.142954_5_plen_43_part_00
MFCINFSQCGLALLLLLCVAVPGEGLFVMHVTKLGDVIMFSM